MIWPLAFAEPSIVGVVALVGGVVLFLVLWWVQHMKPNSDPSSVAQPPSLMQMVRNIIGWPLILIGLIATPLPIPIGIPLLVIGTLLVGTRSPLIRRSLVSLKLLLRRWARVQVPVIGGIGRFFLLKQQQMARTYRQYTARRLSRMQDKEGHKLGDVSAQNNLTNRENETAR